jgi:hypothetical protein
VEEEFALAKRMYQQLGISERIEMGIFEGGHEIHGVESFRFLHRWFE